MCGRFALTAPGEVVADVFGLETAPRLPPRYNIAPTQETAVVRRDPESGHRRLDMLRWGLVPHWAESAEIGNRLINARSETAARKPAFRDSFESRRCLVVASGFYEWKRSHGRKQPHYFHLPSRRPMALAGLWDSWRDGAGALLETFTILTTEANAVLAPVHGRMPLILDRRAFEPWLAASATEVNTLLTSYQCSDLVGHAVSTYVNSPQNDSPHCLEPAAEELGLF